MKKILLIASLFAASAFCASAQSQNTVPSNAARYQWNLINMGTNSIPYNSTNTFSGVSVITTNTVTSVLYTNTVPYGAGGPGFYTNTVNTTSTNTVYPIMSIPYVGKTAIQISFNCNTNSTSNAVFQVYRSVTGVWGYYFPYTNLTIAANGTNTVGGVLDLAGIGSGSLALYSGGFTETNSSTAPNITNLAGYYSVKQDAP